MEPKRRKINEFDRLDFIFGNFLSVDANVTVQDMALFSDAMKKAEFTGFFDPRFCSLFFFI
jgi:hypothetical protein